MKKNLIALAVAAAFVAPAAAMADTANVTLSGKVAADVTFLSNTDQTAAGADNETHQVNNNNSVITLAGGESLGNGMKAFFSLTYGLPLASGGTISGQNQIAGLEGGFGKVFLGAFDNPLKVMGRGVDLFADQSTGDSRHMTSVGFVEARANDVMAYISPSFSGFQAVLAHANNPVSGVATDGSNAALRAGGVGAVTALTDADTQMNIIKLAYANGPLSAAIGWHKVGLASAAGTQDEKAWRVTGGYTAGAIKVVGSYQKVSDGATFRTATTDDIANGATSGQTVATGQADYKVWGLGAAYTMGATTIKGQYYKVNNDTTADADSHMVALGVDYAMSKRTTLQAAYSKVSNDAGANRGGAAVVGGSDTYAVANGADPQRVSLGLKHTF